MKTINLYKNNCLKIRETNCKISCKKGILWITFTGGKDIILQKGEEITLKEKNLILQGIEDSSLVIEAA